MALHCGCFGRDRLVRVGAAALVLASVLFLAGSPAEAHHYSRHRHYAHVAHAAHHPHYARAAHAHYWRAARYAHARRAYPHPLRVAAGTVPASPAFSALVVDANSGRTLYSLDENGLRHPASITKVMTLYLLFEDLDRGSMTLRTQIPISAHAAAQEPSKLGLRPGDTISVDDAIKAIVTRSANDIAVAVAEAIGGSEGNFAEMMTRKARALGMTNTAYVNASGLPDDRQITTAHDLTILGRAMEERFPRYFRYFSIAQFDFDGERIGNHDHLLGRVDGVDGIKTGYTRASGFNLLTSVHRDGRSLIAVVMGGRSAAGRDRIMANLIADHMAEASTTRTASLVAEASYHEAAEPRAEPPVRPRSALITEAAMQRVSAAPSNEAGEGDNSAGDDEGPAPQSMAKAGAPAWALRAAEQRLEAASAIVPPARLDNSDAGRPPAQAQAPEQGDERDVAAAAGSWMIQIGAPDSRAKADALLSRARERNRFLASAKPVTEKVRKGDATLYRARFAVVDSASAEAACRTLKRTGFSCFPAHD